MKYFFLSFLGMWLMAFDFAPRIHFEKNSFEISETEKNILAQNIDWLSENRGAVFILEGHCDEWGLNNYNLELGDKRAREVKAYLIEKGVDPERIIMVVSYGASRPLDARPTMEGWAANRRVEFVLR